MSIVKAFTLPHPPLAIPAVGRGKEYEISKTLAAMDEVAGQIAALAPETIIYITPHSILYSDYFHISPGGMASGDLGRFGCPNVRFDTIYDEELADEIERVAKYNDVLAGTQGEKDARLDHGVTVPMWYINRRYTDYQSVRVSQSGMSPSEHYLFGQVIAKAIENTDRKTVVIASSDLSHKLGEKSPYGFSEDGLKFDDAFVDAISEGDFFELLKMPTDMREKAAECGYNSMLILAGCLDKQNVEADLLSYEGQLGVGYAVASFCAAGFNAERNILEKYVEYMPDESRKKQNAEDEYQKLARQALEHAIKTDEKMNTPGGLPVDMTSKRAGVFVSIHKDGMLRGCIGTIAPTTASIAEEIVQNAISAGLSDNRFSPIDADEMCYLSYKVDILSESESISGVEELDVKKYGVIVTSGRKRGLLLPNLDGIDCVDEQIRIACGKAGITKGDKIALERFEVIRHG